MRAVTPASAATFSLLPGNNASGNVTKQTQLVPVKVELDQPEPRLSIGTSVEVRVLVQPQESTDGRRRRAPAEATFFPIGKYLTRT